MIGPETYTSTDCDQLTLDLFKGEPWDGRSPRSLTRAGLAFIFKPKAPSHEVFFNPENYMLWPIDRPPRGKSSRRAVSPAASLLLPLPRRI